jgi:S-adenosylmethionine decarboxylase proenzyme
MLYWLLPYCASSAILEVASNSELLSALPNSVGEHVIAEMMGVDAALLNNASFLEAACRQAAIDGGLTVIDANFHKFAPQGVTGVVVLAESHLSIHTWPETNYAAVDVFACNQAGGSNPQESLRSLTKMLAPSHVETKVLPRGPHQVRMPEFSMLSEENRET